MRSRLAAYIAVSAVVLGSAATMAASAQASVTRGTVTADTKIVTRYDSGGAGNWAYDGTKAVPMNRVLTITYLGDSGPAGTPYQYEATLTDKGDFLTIPGALAPNQGGRDAGKVLSPTQRTGVISGFADYTLDSSQRVNSPREWANLGVPTALRGVIQNDAYPTGTWPELAFPASATFAGVNLYDWGWTYQVPARVVTVHGHKHTVKAQNWADTLANGAGQDARDGNITG
jgi:hypothetical protein